MDFRIENKNQNERFRRLLNRLDSTQWQRDIGGGWTTGTMICHLAFWEKMTSFRLKKWIETGTLAAVPDADNILAINDSVRDVSTAIGFEAGSKLAIQAMDEIDGLVAGLDESRLAELEKTGRERWFKRSLHRDTHLTRIENTLA
ncbi:MAG: maleylpyruvate isomerase N-terminal domain-containing protein [Spirochaetia bacterium]|nr:maleylpyruvate isomerase N-terminal domain-containing protein [Spirochaetia bacterium]